jgi:hypothetical protein
MIASKHQTVLDHEKIQDNHFGNNSSQISEELKEGEYFLSFAQINSLNKMLEKGFKFELIENVSKISEPIAHKSNNSKKHKVIKELSSISEEKSIQKKRKKNEILDLNALSKEDSVNLTRGNDSFVHKRSLREKKPNLIKDLGYIDKDFAKAAKTGLTQDVFKKCEKVLQKLKKHVLSDSFFSHINPDVPTLGQVEKQLKAYLYTSVFQFGMDVRKIWNHYFTNETNNTEIYQKTFTLSNYFEEIFKEVESNPEEKTDLHELQKKVNKLQEKFNEINQNKSISNSNLKRERSGSNLDKPMSMAEKNMLGNNIRLLTPEQLKGIIKILNESLSVDQSKKYFEFDIETLSSKKLRELDKYVKSCLKMNSAGGVAQTGEKKKSNFEDDKINQLKVEFSVKIERLSTQRS